MTEPGALSTVSSHMVWMESMIAQAGAFGIQRGQNIAQIGFGAQG